jgi:hypothetical protein
MNFSEKYIIGLIVFHNEKYNFNFKVFGKFSIIPSSKFQRKTPPNSPNYGEFLPQKYSPFQFL